MLLALRILIRPASLPVLSADPEIAQAIGKHGLLHTHSSSPLFPRIVERARDSVGIWINPVGEFTRQEIESCEWLQPELRGKIITETTAESEFNRAALKACKLFHAGTAAWIRRPEGLALSRMKIHPNEIGGLTEYLSEWVVPDGVTQVFADAGLKGWSVKPLRDLRRDQNAAGYGQLFTDVLLPPARIDRTTPRNPPGPGWRQMGCLTYDAGALAEVKSDFARTAEDWSNNHVPEWVVSRQVRECCQAHKLKGWAYRPVLEAGTELAQTYTRVWEDMFSLTDGVPCIRF